MLWFTRSQRNGLLVLASLIVLSLFAPLFIELFETEIEDYSDVFAKFEKEIDLARRKTNSTIDENRAVQLFKFNPNKASEKEFQSLGLNQKQIKQIINYRTKGGVFRSKKDFSKIYAINDSTFSALEPYIFIVEYKKEESTKDDHKALNTSVQSLDELMLELNSASEKDLQELKGIGPTFSKRIVKYRNILGGFVNKMQLLEVYGIEEETLAAISPFLKIDQVKLSKLKINFISASELNSHPYFDKSLAKKIVKERTFKGSYKSLQDFKEKLQLENDFIKKIEPYLQF